MMKKYEALLLLHVICFSSMILNGMESTTTLTATQKTYQGPMDSTWFYDKNQFELANLAHAHQNWKEAAQVYEIQIGLNTSLVQLRNYIKSLQSKTTISTCKIDPQDSVFSAVNNIVFADEYSQNMARLNLAACLMAQRKAAEHWSAFDALLNIEESQRISTATIIDALYKQENKTILVRTDQIGIGDIFCFLSAAYILKIRTKFDIILLVPQFLKQTLMAAKQHYGFGLFDTNDKLPHRDYETHLISLLGHLKLTPAEMRPQPALLSKASGHALGAVMETITPVLTEEKNLAVVFLGENRQATLIGGKQLPRNTHSHGRHLDSEAFNMLLKKYPHLTLLDCGNTYSRIAINEDQKNRCLILHNEAQPFDKIIALAEIMNEYKTIICFGADNDQTKVFARALNPNAQDRMALIIPNAKEHDMCMSGEGEVYKHMLSNCWVYKCPTPADQTQVVELAYQNMLTYNS